MALPQDDVSTDSPSSKVDDALALAVEQQESSGNPYAIGAETRYGTAKGLMQLLDTTGEEQLQTDIKRGDLAEGTQYEPFNPDLNRKLGRDFLDNLTSEFGDERLVLAGYNAGPGTVKKLQSQYGPTYDDIAAHLPAETRKYVPSVLSKKEKLTESEDGSNPLEEARASEAAAVNTAKAVAPTPKGFAEAITPIISDPAFNSLSYDEQIGAINQIYKSRQWAEGTLDVYKHLTNSIWDTAVPEERPDLEELVGPPPVTPQGEDPKKHLGEWRDSTVQELLRKGVLPAQFGDNLDKYLNNASQSETDAANYRNENGAEKAIYGTGNFIRNIAKGGTAAVADTIGALIRLTPIGDTAARQEIATRAESAPEVFGNPTKAYLYETTETGALKLNPDGTPQTRPEGAMQSVTDFAAKTIGFGASLLIGAGELKALTSAPKAIALLTTQNALLIGGSSFKSVYDQTGDTAKSYKAAVLAMPVGAVLGTLGEMMVLGKEVPVAVESLTAYDKARIIGASLAKKGAAGGAAGLGIDVAQQLAEKSQTGQAYDPNRTIQMVAGSAGVGAVGGAITDVAHAQNSYENFLVQEKSRSAEFQGHLTNFRDSIDQVRTIQGKAAATAFSHELGIDVTPNEDGTTTLSKRIDGVPEAQTIPDLVESVGRAITPDEVTVLAKEAGQLAAKQNKTAAEELRLQVLNTTIAAATRPEYLNNIRATENLVAEQLKEAPGALMVRWDASRNVWQNPETGETGRYLKDILFPKKESARFDQDVSDLSHLRIIHEEALTPPAAVEPISAKGTEENLNIQRQLDKVNGDLLELKNQRDAAKGDEEAVSTLKVQISEKVQEARALKAEQLKLKPTIDTEEAFNASEKTRFEEEKKQFNEDKKALTRARRGGKGKAGQYDPNTNSIVIFKGGTPESREQTVAHEVGHAVADKLVLPEDAKRALDTAHQDLMDRSIVESAKETAGKMFLPDIAKITEAPTDVSVSELNTRSKRAFGKDELLANQIAAIMLKRSGRPLGDYKIIPELESALERTKLPDLNSLRVSTTEGPPTEPVTSVTKQQFVKQSQSEWLHDSGQELKYIRQQGVSVPELKHTSIEHRLDEPIVKNFENRGLDLYQTRYSSTPNDLQLKLATTPEEGAGVKIVAKLSIKNGEVEHLAVTPSLQGQGIAKELLRKAADILGEKPRLQKDRVQSNVASAYYDVFEKTQSTRQEPPNEQPPPGGASLPPASSLKTGEVGETAYSKTLRQNVPERPADLYEKVSAVKAQPEMDVYVREKGLRNAIDIYKNPETYSIAPEQQVLLANAIEAEGRRLIDTNPTPENYELFNDATQVRSTSLTTHAQMMALGSRFRSADTFPDFIAQVAKSYREAGLEPPKLTQDQLTKLEKAFRAVSKLPKDNVLRVKRTMDLFRETLKMEKMDWPDFLAKMMQRNLLTGVGTGLTVAISSAWLQPMLTALAHPFLGRGIAWKAMADMLPFAAKNAKNAFEGRAVYNMYRGLNDIDYLKPTPSDTYANWFAKIHTKFTNPFINTLSAVHTYFSTLAESAYLAENVYKDLKAKYGDDINKFTAEVAKLRVSKEQIANAYSQAHAEAKALGGDISPSDVDVRAYQIIRQQGANAAQLEQAHDWTLQTSHMGDPISPLHQAALSIINSRVLNDFIPLRIAKTIALPFGNALIRLSDIAFNFVPGAGYLANAAMRDLTIKLRPEMREALELTPTQKFRLQKSQMIGTGLAFGLLGLSRSGAIQITGDEEKQLGENKGEAASNRKEFKEAEEKGVPAYSIILPGLKYSLEYKDLPGINAIAYGLYRLNKSIDAGESLMDATAAFYRGSIATAVPFFGNSTLEAPIVKFVQDLFDSSNSGKLKKSFETLTENFAKELTPGSSFLRDVKHIYDSTPEETNQNLATRAFRDVPGLSEMLGSKPQIDRIGNVITRTPLERTPGLYRLVSEEKTPTDPFWEEVKNNNIIIPEMRSSIKFTDADFKRSTANWQATKEERIAKAGSLTLTPDEWYAFRLATAPYVKARVTEIMSQHYPDPDDMQKAVTETVQKIDKTALENYIRTGKF